MLGKKAEHQGMISEKLPLRHGTKAPFKDSPQISGKSIDSFR